MLSNGQVFVFVSSILGSALSDFTSPRRDVDLYKRQHRTIEIPWKFTGNVKILSVDWKYKKLDSSAPMSKIYTVGPNGKPVGGIPVNQFTDRLNFRGDISNNDFTLTIKDFVKGDEGIFTCELKSEKLYSLPITIKATVLSNVTEFKTIGSNSSEILQGDNITLSCTTTMGQPSPIVEIRRENTVKNSTTASNTSETSILYHFEQISEDEEGIYTCQVTTQGFTSKKSLQLDVKYPPKIIPSVKPEQFGCRGKLMMIDCRASGDPKPIVMIIGPDGKSLTKNEFVLKEYGTYRCEAYSKLGNDSLNITVNPATDKPEAPIFEEDCSFTKLTWKASSDKSVKYTLQVREEGSKGVWGDIITSIDTRYSPSTNDSFSKKKDYEFRIVARNCVGSTENKGCIVKGESVPPEESERSSSINAGVIAGSVIAVLVVILIIVIAAVYFRRKKRRESPTVRLNKKSPPTAGSDIKPKPGGLLYSDSPNMDAPRVRPPVEYRQDEYDDDGYEYADDTAVSHNVPSWV